MGVVLRLSLLLCLCAVARAQYGGSSQSVAFDFVGTTNLPLIVIDLLGETLIQNDDSDPPKQDCWVKALDTGANQIATTTAVFEGACGVEARGESSAWWPKRQYGLEFRDEFGEDLAVELFGLPAEADWVLHGPYSDKSALRNAMYFHMARQTEDYYDARYLGSRFRFVEVVFKDGTTEAFDYARDYRGLYVLLEGVKRDRNRVKVKKLQPEDDTLDTNISGGYILRHGKYDDGQLLINTATSSTPVVVRYPKPDKITSAQTTWITNWLNGFDATWAAHRNWRLNGGSEPSPSAMDKIHIQSWADYMLVTELGKDIDGYRISTYLSKQRDEDYLVAGPMWDCNLCFGNAYYDFEGEGSTHAWVWDRGNTSYPYTMSQGQDEPYWFYEASLDDRVRCAMKWRWEQNYKAAGGAWTKSVLNGVINGWTSTWAGGFTRNAEEWGYMYGRHDWPNVPLEGPWPQNHGEYVEQFRDWMEDRLDWMDAQISSWSVSACAPPPEPPPDPPVDTGDDTGGDTGGDTGATDDTTGDTAGGVVTGGPTGNNDGNDDDLDGGLDVGQDGDPDVDGDDDDDDDDDNGGRGIGGTDSDGGLSPLVISLGAVSMGGVVVLGGVLAYRANNKADEESGMFVGAASTKGKKSSKVRSRSRSRSRTPSRGRKSSKASKGNRSRSKSSHSAKRSKGSKASKSSKHNSSRKRSLGSKNSKHNSSRKRSLGSKSGKQSTVVVSHGGKSKFASSKSSGRRSPGRSRHGSPSKSPGRSRHGSPTKSSGRSRSGSPTKSSGRQSKSPGRSRHGSPSKSPGRSRNGSPTKSRASGDSRGARSHKSKSSRHRKA